MSERSTLGRPPQSVNVIDASLIGDFVSTHGWLFTAGHVSSDVVLLSLR